MKCLDLFSGLGGFSASFKQNNWDVFTVDVDSKFTPDLCADVMSLHADKEKWANFDVVLASPPCQNFSVANLRNAWKNGIPSKSTRAAILLLLHTLDIIEAIAPKYWFLENPRGMMRHILGRPAATTNFCAFDEPRAKPTDIWTNFPNFNPPRCKGNDHEPAPRGSTSGTQRLRNPADRAKIPYGLSDFIRTQIEANLKPE